MSCKKILIADDEPVNLILMTKLLKEIGFDVLTAKDGQEALEIIEFTTPDLVILDIMMPKVDGLEVCKRIKDNRNLSFIPVMIVSALDDHESKKKGMENGADEFLAKPVDKFELQTRIKTLLKIKRLYDDLKANQLFLRQVVDNLPHMIYVLDEHNKLVLVNKALADSFGRTVEQCLGKKYKDLYAKNMDKPEQSIQRMMDLSNAKILDKGIKMFISDFSFTDINGNKKILQITKLPIEVPDKGKGILEVSVDVTKLKTIQEKLEDANRQLEIQAVSDSLTGLLNHKAIYEKLEDEIKRVKRYNCDLSVVMMDIDDFKVVNDTWGHQMGDRVLRRVSDIIMESIRDMDVAGRYGGEEFLIILPYTDIKGAMKLSERIKKEIGMEEFGKDIRITISGGVASYNGESTLTLVEKADINLYKAKQMGKNRIVV